MKKHDQRTHALSCAMPFKLPHLLPLLSLLLAACASTPPNPARNTTHKFASTSSAPPSIDASQLVKTDIDRMAEAHRQELQISLRLLSEKLYRRNPREWKKSGAPDLETAVNRLMDPNTAWRFAEFEGKYGSDAIQLAFREDYRGDRVQALIGGLGGMLHNAFDEKTEFYITDDLDAQKIYNSARNLEITIWRLSNARDLEGKLFLLSNAVSTDQALGQNLSFEREFGRMIGQLDLLARIIADKNNRTLVKMIQSIATAVFIPITSIK